MSHDDDVTLSDKMASSVDIQLNTEDTLTFLSSREFLAACSYLIFTLLLILLREPKWQRACLRHESASSPLFKPL